MRTLVTGAAGFLGAHILRNLAQDRYALGLDVRAPVPGSEAEYLLRDLPEDHFVQCDITDLSAVMRVVKKHEIDQIFHASALTHVPTLRDHPMTALMVNTVGVLNILEVARVFPIARIVCASSISVYADKRYEPIDELHPVLIPNERPNLLSYSASKLAAEAFLMHYWGDHSVDALSLRFTGLYGLGMRYPMYMKPMVENAAKRAPTIMAAGGDAARDYVFVEDAAEAVRRAMDAPAAALRQRIYNIATGELLPARRIAESVRSLVPEAVIEIGPGVPEAERRTLEGRGLLATAAAARDLEFRCSISLEEGIVRYFESYREYLAWQSSGNRA